MAEERKCQSVEYQIEVAEGTIYGTLEVPDRAVGVVVFAHGSGSSRYSPRNRWVAAQMRESGLATLLFDLLTASEEEIDLQTAEYRFDIPRLGSRCAAAVRKAAVDPLTAGLRIGCYGSSTGAAAALIAAVEAANAVKAVVSRGGRPDLAAESLAAVNAPTLLIVGERDEEVIALNRWAQQQMAGECALELVAGATHLFEEPGALDTVTELATKWFLKYLRN